MRVYVVEAKKEKNTSTKKMSNKKPTDGGRRCTAAVDEVL